MAQNLAINLRIAHDDLAYLQTNKCNLCVSKDAQFNGRLMPGNVVFSGLLSQDLAPRVGLQWRESYQVYGTKSFEASAAAGLKVTVDTHTRNIEGGQVALFHKDGAVGLSGYPLPGTPFNVNNQWASQACIGVSNYDVLTNTYSPFFISPQVLESSTSTLFPMQLYSVFWDANLVPGLMFDNAHVSGRYLFGFPVGTTEITLAYKGKEWAIVG